MKLRSKKLTAQEEISKMPDDYTLRHKFQTQANVPKFKGRVNGGPCDCEAFIKAVDNHLKAQGISSETEAFTEAMTFMDLSPESDGDVRSFVMGYGFNKLKTWEELKKHLREIYRTLGRKDSVHSLSKLIRRGMQDTTNYLKYSPILFAQTSEWLEVLNSSTWVEDDKCETSKIAEMIGMAILLARLPESFVESLVHTWKPGEGISKLDQLIQENKAKHPNLELASTSSIAAININKRFEETEESDKNKKPRSKIVCCNCQRTGHYQSECRAPSYCTYHKVTGHRNDKCRSLNFTTRTRGRGGKYKLEGRSRSRNSGRRSPTPKSDSSSYYTEENFHQEDTVKKKE